MRIIHPTISKIFLVNLSDGSGDATIVL